MSDFIVEIRPDGAKLQLEVRFDQVTDNSLKRDRLNLDPAKIDLLRSGEVDPLTEVTLSGDVSDWLLDPSLRPYLNTAFANGQPFRLVLRAHDEALTVLADVPFELIQWGPDPFLLKPTVRAIVHALAEGGSGIPSPGIRSWPLKILIVRSNPVQLGNAVPPAAGLRDAIQDMGTALYGAHNVQVTLLSREPGVGKPVTFDELRAELTRQTYDILVFLGHGDVVPGFEELPPSNVLQFESPDGQRGQPKEASQLKVELQNRAVPVVLLAGCLTAAQIPAAEQAVLRGSFPQWMRGNQGVAQALVGSESGVQVAIGMRYKLETTDAEMFLKAFFKSLLQDAPGDVEAGVRAGRRDLHAAASHPPSWSAPVIFRRLGQEPLFDFLLKAPPQMDVKDVWQQERRAAAWNFLKEQPRSGGADFAYQTITDAETDVQDRTIAKGVPLFMPDRQEAAPGEAVEIAVNLFGALKVREVRGKVVFSDSTLQGRDAHGSAALLGAGFRARFDVDVPGEVGFTLEHAPAPPAPKAAALLPPGPLFQFKLDPGKIFPALYIVQVDDLVREPAGVVRGWSNAVIVSPA